MFTGRTQFRTQSLITAGAIALASVLLSATAQAQGLSSDPHDLHDAFARHANSVNTPQAFANAVEQNDALRSAYARHFAVPQDQLVSFFRTALVPYTLPTTQSFTTYGVTRAGNIYPVNTTLPKGTRVWATRDNVPVLKWNCSNPLTAILPGSNMTPPVEFASTPSPVLPEGNTPIPSVPDTFATVSSPSLPDGSDQLAIAPTAPLDGPTFAFAVPSTSGSSSDSLPGIGEIVDAAGPSIKDFWPALLVPVLLVGSHGSSSVGSGETPPYIGAVVVPEANTMGLLGLGLPMLGFAGLVARRRK